MCLTTKIRLENLILPYADHIEHNADNIEHNADHIEHNEIFDTFSNRFRLPSSAFTVSCLFEMAEGKKVKLIFSCDIPVVFNMQMR
jgi:hypothetical protein